MQTEISSKDIVGQFRGELLSQRDWIHHGGGCKTESRTNPSAPSNICLARCLPALAPQSVVTDTSTSKPRLKMNYSWAFLENNNILFFEHFSKRKVYIYL